MEASGARLMVRVKHRWAQLVLGWVTHTPPGGTGLSDDTEESRSYPRLLRRLYHGGAEWRSSNGVCRVNAHEDLPILMRNNRVDLFCFVSCDFFSLVFWFLFLIFNLVDTYDSYEIIGTAGVVVSCKIPILASRVRFSGGARFLHFLNSKCV